MKTNAAALAEAEIEFADEARQLTAHLISPNPRRYWLDFLASNLVGAAAFFATVSPAIPAFLRAAAFLVCVVAWYRSFVFIHEVIHARGPAMKRFRLWWNVLAGIPFLCPSFMYVNHLEHHSKSIYGTGKDGEYLGWGVKPPAHLVWFIAGSLVAPFLVVGRFSILVPMSWMVRGLRTWLDASASAIAVHPFRERTPLGGQALRRARIQELCSTLWIFLLGAAGFSGVVSWRGLATFIGVTAAISLLNAIRTVLSHRFRNEERPLSFVEQIQDSVNHPGGGWLTEVVCPVGLRFHALHHLLPSLPYHALPEAHRILMQNLPKNSPYRSTNSRSLWMTACVLWTGASRARRRVR